MGSGRAGARRPLCSRPLTSRPLTSAPARARPRALTAAAVGARGPRVPPAAAARASAALRPTAGGRREQRAALGRCRGAGGLRDSPSHGPGPRPAGSGLGRRGGGGRRRFRGVAFGGKNAAPAGKRGAGARSPSTAAAAVAVGKADALSGRFDFSPLARCQPPLKDKPRRRWAWAVTLPPGRRRARGRRLPGGAERPCPRRARSRRGVAVQPGSAPAGQLPRPRPRALLWPGQAGPSPFPPFPVGKPEATDVRGETEKKKKKKRQLPEVSQKNETNVV